MSGAPLSVELRRVSYAYNDDGPQALRDVDFQAGAGEFIGLLAPNGSGKTTLLKVIIGLLRPQTGQVLVEGRALHSYPLRVLRCKVGLVWQNPNDQLFLPTVQEDVAFGPRNLGLSESAVRQRVSEALAAVGASELCQRQVHHLSLGEKKRVSIAGVLAMEPRIVLADEPTAGLDPLGESQVLAVLAGLGRTKGITVVMATHSVDPLPVFADRLYVLCGGRVLSAGPVADVLADAGILAGAQLRLPYVADLIDQLKRLDRVPIEGFPMTVADARQGLLKLLLPAQAGGSGGTQGAPP